MNKTTELFSDKAESYAKFRPAYPAKMIERLLSNLPTKDQNRAIDVGAGTGISSLLIAKQGVKVVAIEPNAEMIQAGEKHPNLQFVKGPAERIPFDDSSTDLVTSFQSFHWFDFKESLKEFNRVLQPTGKLGIVWSYWDESDAYTREYVNLINEATKKNITRVTPYDGFPKGKIKKLRIRFLWRFRKLPYFNNVERYTYKYMQQLDEEGLIGCARSQSFLINEGPVWDELVDGIRSLKTTAPDKPLVYNINLFTANPVK